MQNGFNLRRAAKKRAENDKSDRLNHHNRSYDEIQQAEQSIKRKRKWLLQHDNKQMAEICLNGTQSLLHPDLHQFRDFSPEPSIIPRKYMPEKSRILLNITQYLGVHYIKEPFDQSAPYLRNGYLRPRNKLKEKPKKFHFRYTSETERVDRAIRETICTTEPLNLKQFIDPKYRLTDKRKFVTILGFRNRLRRNFSRNHDSQAWNTLSENPHGGEYTGGFEEVGSILRTREKAREIPRVCSTYCPPKVESIRRYHTELALKEILSKSSESSFNRTLSQKHTTHNSQTIIEEDNDYSTQVPQKNKNTALSKMRTRFYKKTLEQHYIEKKMHPMREIVQRKLQQSSQYHNRSRLHRTLETDSALLRSIPNVKSPDLNSKIKLLFL